MLVPIKISDDLIARFLMSSRHFKRSTSKVHAAAFMPPPDLRLSVYRIRGLTEADVWSLGARHVAKPSGRNIHARADLHESVVSDVGLRLEHDDKPPRHSSITGWADESQQWLRALELADRAKLRLPPSGA